MIYDEIRQYKEDLDRLLGRINEKKYSKQNQAEKSNIIDVYSDNLSLGFGDIYNKFSYLYNQNDDRDVWFWVHDKRKFFDLFLLLKNYCFEEPKHKKTLVDSQFFLKSKSDFRLVNHDYWPTKVKWKPSNKKIAINFYTKVLDLFYRQAKYGEKYVKQLNIELCKLFHDSQKIRERYDVVELYAIEDRRGQNKIIPSVEDCLVENIDILSNCQLLVTSEGGMAHLSRGMKLPTIIFLKEEIYGHYSFFQNFIDKKIQKIVSTTEEMINSIDYFLEHDKFN